MKAVVLYESMFGNTRLIAEAIRSGLAELAETTLINVNAVTRSDIDAADLMVIGGPTHVHGMSRESTRAEAVKWTSDPKKALTLEPEAPGKGIREWLETTSVSPLFAAFATRADIPILLSGNVAAQIEHAMRAKATRRVVPGETFFVTKDNRLKANEITRARAWGKLIAGEASRHTATGPHTQ